VAQVCRANNLVASYGRFSVALPYLESYLRSVNGAVSMSSAPSITATPLTPGGRTTLTWQASGHTQVQIRIGSPTGPAMTGLEPPVGSAQSGNWVVDGMIFYLQDASDGDSLGSAKTLASVSVKTAGGVIRGGTITASPNPVRVAAGQSRGATTLNWRATGVTQIQIRVGSSAGSPLTGIESATGSTSTGNWVTDGLTFYLQDASDGSSSGPSKTLATVRVTVASR